MLTTNLLPPAEKKNVEREAVRRIALFFMFTFSAIFAVGMVLLFPSYFNLYLEKGELEKAFSLEEEAALLLKIKERMQYIETLRTVMESIKLNLSRPGRTSSLLSELLRRQGGITIGNLYLKKDGEVSLGGIASTRNSLLEFEKMLRESGNFQELTSPDYTKKTDINFTMQGKLKPTHKL